MLASISVFSSTVFSLVDSKLTHIDDQKALQSDKSEMQTRQVSNNENVLQERKFIPF